MKKNTLHLLTYLCLMFAVFSFAGCDDDYFDNFDDYYPPHYNNGPIEGCWVISDIEGKYCSYNINEEWYFYSNGDFETRGYEDLNEFGRWRKSYDEVQITFDGQDRELFIRINGIDHYHMSLSVIDKAYDVGYENKIKYRLFMNKVSSHYPWSMSKSTDAQIISTTFEKK